MIQPNPMMCGACCTPLNYVSDAFGARYAHPAWVGKTWDHAAVPVPRDESRQRGVCDFCASDHPVTAFYTRKAIVQDEGGKTHVFSEPWASCERCAVHIRNRSPHLLLDRAVAVLPGRLNQPERQARRAALKPLYMKFFQAEPDEVAL
ncbi:hypothetical protein [Streptomyces sp. NBC_01304]|uniref:hypothetical protein n=1 Tax=Streptomyces sp. NBC_01304 TaxID=2903818 RepID=UPI002E10C4FF|nr:hypothetical protein OG430_48555 [Streptomyces sp. NBC_01304]